MQIIAVNSPCGLIIPDRVLIHYAVLGSGSSGNAYAFEYDNYLLLVDAGFKAKVIYQRLKDFGFSLHKSTYIFCTHTHHDHVSGVNDLASLLDAVVVGTQQLLEHLDLPLSVDRWSVITNAYYSLPVGAFYTFTTSHDAPMSLSYYLELGGVGFMILTDTGRILPAMYRLAFYSHILFLESNYDESMLARGSYPAFLKRRVGGDKGHLSNRQSKEFLTKIANSQHLRQVFLCHISDQNNDMSIVEQELVSRCSWSWQSYLCQRAVASQLFKVEL